jgi:hypothetical protein
MKRARVSICLAVAIALAVPLGAQTRPNVAGKWVLIGDQSTPPPSERHQPEITITQDAQTVTLTQSGYMIGGRAVSSGGGGFAAAPRVTYQYSMTYDCDGAEHPTPKAVSVEPQSTPAPAPTEGWMAVTTTDSSYRATWTRAHTRWSVTTGTRACP